MKILAAKIFIVMCLFLAPSYVCSGGIPVIDGANLSQNMLTAVEEIAQTLKQVQEYKTQMDQYERQVNNSLDFDEFLWDEADSTISDMLGTISSIEAMKNLAKDTAGYLDAMKDGVTSQEIDNMYARFTNLNDRENQTIDELITTIENQQTTIQDDADKLVGLQEKAEEGGAVGQMQALQTANMLSGHMSNQLLQLRSVMQAQSQADAALRLRQNDQDARSEAAKKAIRQGAFIESTKQVF